MAFGIKGFTDICSTGSFFFLSCCFVSLLVPLCTNLIELQLSLQTIDTRIKLAFALAKQWFGVYITPESPNDGMLTLFFAFDLLYQLLF